MVAVSSRCGSAKLVISATYESEDRGTCKQQIYNAKIEVSSGYVSAELEVSNT